MEFTFSPEEKRHHERIARRVEKLRQLLNDGAASEGEKIAANRQIMRLMPELIEGKYLARIDKKIDRMEAATQEIACAETQFQQLL